MNSIGVAIMNNRNLADRFHFLKYNVYIDEDTWRPIIQSAPILYIDLVVISDTSVKAIIR